MAIDLSSVQKGADVLGSDGANVGTVTDVVLDELGGTGLGTGTADHVGDTPNTYITVETKGVLGVGKKTLYVPATQIASIDGNGVTLHCESDSCIEQYDTQPPNV